MKSTQSSKSLSSGLPLRAVGSSWVGPMLATSSFEQLVAELVPEPVSELASDVGPEMGLGLLVGVWFSFVSLASLVSSVWLRRHGVLMINRSMRR